MSTFTIKAHSDTVIVQGFLLKYMQQAIEQGKPLVVRISQKQDEYSDAQRRLYWMWLQEWAKHQGTSKDYEHLFFKRKFLAVIYFRDGVGQYKTTFSAVKQLKASNHPAYKQVADGLNELISITDANTKQFAEYLDEIYNFCLQQGKQLIIPDDLKFLREVK